MTTDALTGNTDGLLARCLAAGNCPKIIKTDSEIEFYQQRASLVVTDTQGNALAMPDNVRLFFLSNLQHNALANAKSELAKTCAFPTNPLNAGPPLRALLVALDAWISTVRRRRQVAIRAAPTARWRAAIDKVGFPRIPGFGYPARIAQPTLLNSDDMPPSRVRFIRYSCRRRMRTAAILPACVCQRWRRQRDPYRLELA